jgi:K+-transporting ATPase ATPase A chain
LILAACILGFSAWACLSKWGPPDPVTNLATDGTNNNGPHGFSEILYAYSSCTGNNGSAFAGLSANTPWYNTTLGLAMLHRAVCHDYSHYGARGFAGAEKDISRAAAGTSRFPARLFMALLMGTILIIGALNFFPAWRSDPSWSTS